MLTYKDIEKIIHDSTRCDCCLYCRNDRKYGFYCGYSSENLSPIVPLPCCDLREICIDTLYDDLICSDYDLILTAFAYSFEPPYWC